MIISALLGLIFSFLNLVLFLELPAMPETIMTVLGNATDYVIDGIAIIRAFTGSAALGLMALIIQLVLFIHTAYMTYSFVRFILKKIPVLNVRM